MISKHESRARRSVKTRAKIKQLGVHRLTINRTPRHIYAQIITADGSVTIAAASTLDKNIAEACKSTGNIAAATTVGKAIAEKAKQVGVTNVAFDRSGFKYHGRVKALADSARENGLEF